MIDGTTIKPGDALIGVASSGVHSNGYSLVRKTLGIKRSRSAAISMSSKSLGGLLTDQIYVKRRSLIGGETRQGISHICGSGFYENVPRTCCRRASSNREEGRSGRRYSTTIAEPADPGARYVQYHVPLYGQVWFWLSQRGRFHVPSQRSLRCDETAFRHRQVRCRRWV